MADFDGLLKVSIGGSSFQLLKYTAGIVPITKEGMGQIGTRLTVNGEGEVTADTPAALSAELGDVGQQLQFAGQDVIVTGVGGAVEFQLLASRCVEGGPHVAVEVLAEGNSLGVKAVKFTATGETAESKSGSSAATTQAQIDTTTRPDETQSIVWTGELVGRDVADRVTNNVIPEIYAKYPDDKWVRSHKITTNAGGDRVKWQAEFTQLLEPLPASAATVDGEVTQRTTRDEKMRLVKELNFDLLVEGDVDAVLRLIRPTGVVIVSESSSATKLKSKRVQASYTTLESANKDDLLDWDARVQVEQEDAPFTTAEYPGVGPVLYQGNVPAYRVRFSGRAIGARRFPKAPAHLYDKRERRPSITYTHLNEVEKQTEWDFNYVMLTPPKSDGTDVNGWLNAANRPAKPEFLAPAPPLPGEDPS